jgi:hypothetical protein
MAAGLGLEPDKREGVKEICENIKISYKLVNFSKLGIDKN